MVKRGFTLPLEPDRFESHRALASKLDRLPAWGIKPAAEPEIEVEDDVVDDGLMPHQRAVVDAIKKNRIQMES